MVEFGGETSEFRKFVQGCYSPADVMGTPHSRISLIMHYLCPQRIGLVSGTNWQHFGAQLRGGPHWVANSDVANKVACSVWDTPSTLRSSDKCWVKGRVCVINVVKSLHFTWKSSLKSNKNSLKTPWKCVHPPTCFRQDELDRQRHIESSVRLIWPGGERNQG